MLGDVTGLDVGVVRGRTVVGKPGGGSVVRAQVVRGAAAKFWTDGLGATSGRDDATQLLIAATITNAIVVTTNKRL